jgi:putative NADH-flavin reductase
MKIAVLGAWGTIGKGIVAEALHRGHAVTGVARRPALANPPLERFSVAAADVTDVASTAKAIAGHDVVVSAVGPAHGAAPTLLMDAARSLPVAARLAQVKRLVVVGGAGSLLVGPGLQLVDTPDFPPAWRPVALAHRDALELWRTVTDLDWTYVSPAAMIAPGTRTGNYQSGDDLLLVDADGQSRISIEDFAVAVLDLVEQASHKRQRVTFAS